MGIENVKKIAIDIFEKYNDTNSFINNENNIMVSKNDIRESIEKIYNNKRQRNMLNEHLKVFSHLGDIIKHATLINQAKETKFRNKYNSWNYYFDRLNIDGKLYSLVFDVVSLANGENHYRLHRLELKNR